MKKNFFITLSLLCLLGCGGGGGGTGAGDPAPTSAILYLSTTGVIPDGQLIQGVTVTVNLPAGVTMQSVTPSGLTAGTGSVVIDPANTDASSVTFTTLGATPFGKGEFTTVTCSIAAGHVPQATDFIVAPGSIITSNTTFETIPSLSVTFAADIH